MIPTVTRPLRERPTTMAPPQAPGRIPGSAWIDCLASIGRALALFRSVTNR